MILQHDIGDADVCLTRCMSKVKYKFNRIEVLTCHVTYPEYIVLASLQIDIVSIDNGFRVVLVGQFDHYSLNVAVTIENTREVVIVGCRCREVGVEVYLCLPLRVALLRYSYTIVVVAQLEEGCEGVSLLVAPTWIWIIVE